MRGRMVWPTVATANRAAEVPLTFAERNERLNRALEGAPPPVPPREAIVRYNRITGRAELVPPPLPPELEEVDEPWDVIWDEDNAPAPEPVDVEERERDLINQMIQELNDAERNPERGD